MLFEIKIQPSQDLQHTNAPKKPPAGVLKEKVRGVALTATIKDSIDPLLQVLG